MDGKDREGRYGEKFDMFTCHNLLPLVGPRCRREVLEGETETDSVNISQDQSGPVPGLGFSSPDFNPTTQDLMYTSQRYATEEQHDVLALGNV